MNDLFELYLSLIILSTGIILISAKIGYDYNEYKKIFKGYLLFIILFIYMMILQINYFVIYH